LAIITNLLVSAFRAIERPDVSFRTNLLGVGMTIAISLVLVFRFGLLGVAIGTLIGDAVTMAVMSTRLKKQLSSDTKAIAAIGAPVPCGTGQA
jgi:Na+-driven multidrug efflux pump